MSFIRKLSKNIAKPRAGTRIGRQTALQFVDEVEGAIRGILAARWRVIDEDVRRRA